MDPTYDYLFNEPCLISSYNNPCPNGGSDSNFLLRYLVRKYDWLDIIDINQWQSNMVEFENNDHLTIRVRIVSFKSESENVIATADRTKIYFEIQTTENLGIVWQRGILFIFCDNRL